MSGKIPTKVDTYKDRPIYLYEDDAKDIKCIWLPKSLYQKIKNNLK